jgi:phage-related minor tail protein
MTNFVGRLGVTLGLNSAEFTRGIESAKGSLQALGGFVKQYGAIAAAGFSAAAGAALRYADEVVDVAKANDVAVSSIVQLRNALASTGGEASNASKLLSSFTQYIDKAADGSFEAQKTLQGLGVSLQDLKTLSIDELFKKAASGLSQMDDTLTRNAKSVEVFGRAMKGVDVKDFSEQVNKVTTADLKRHEEGLKAAADAYDMLAERSRKAMEGFAATIGPGIKAAIEQFDKLTDAIKKAGDEFLQMAKKYEKLFAIMPGFRLFLAGQPGAESGQGLNQEQLAAQDAALANRPGVGGARTPVRTVTAGVNKPAEEAAKKEMETRRRVMALREQDKERQIREFEELREYQKKYAEDQEREQQRLSEQAARDMALRERDRERQIRELQELLDYQKQYREELERQKAVVAERRTIDIERQQKERQEFIEYLSAQKKQEVALENEQSASNEMLRRERIMMELNEKARLMKAQDVQLAQEVLSIQWKHADAVKRINSIENISAEARKKALQEQLHLSQQEMDLAQQRYELANRVRAGTFSQGFEEAAIQSVENAMSAFKAGQQTFNVLMGSMEDAIAKFVQTGKLSFKDLARSIISDIIAIQMRAQISRLFGLIGSVGVPQTMGPNLVNQELGPSFDRYLAGASPRAEGGPVMGGSPYLVGERGPELFVPRGSGAIVPTNHLAAMMGGGQTVNYNGPVIQNMSAIDTQSGLEFLSRNKQAVWAANQSAQRSLPMSR